MTEPRLYGLEDDEYLEHEYEDALEKLIDGMQAGETATLYEFSATPASSKMPDVSQVMEYIHNYTCENDLEFEDACDQIIRAGTEAVATLIHQALQEWAKGVSFLLADKVIRSWTVKCEDREGVEVILIDDVHTHTLVNGRWEEVQPEGTTS